MGIGKLLLGRGRGNRNVVDDNGKPLYDRQAAKAWGEKNFTPEQRKMYGAAMKRQHDYGVKKGMAMQAKKDGTYRSKKGGR